MPKLPKITSLLFFLQYLKKELSDEVDFLHTDKHESLVQIDSMILMGIVKHSQSSQNSKLHEDKHQSFLKVYFNTLGIKVSYKVDIIIITGHDKAFSNYSK